MLTIIRGAALAACALALTGCGANSAALGQDVLGNLEHCERTYIASVGGIGVPGGSLSIRCPAKPYEPEPPAQ